MSGLRECPWCADSVLEVRQSVTSGVQWVTCTGCGASGPEHDTEAAATAAWNRRASPWRTMETAPIRRRILAYGTVPEREGVQAETNIWIAYRWPEGWGICGGHKIIATHWQPLPEPPEGV